MYSDIISSNKELYFKFSIKYGQANFGLCLHELRISNAWNKNSELKSKR